MNTGTVVSSHFNPFTYEQPSQSLVYLIPDEVETDTKSNGVTDPT